MKYNLKDIRSKLLTDPHFVNSKRFNYDIENVLNRYPDGCPEHVIASLLQIELDDISEIYEEIVLKLRKEMGIETD